MKFWDTSALLPLCLKEPWTVQVKKLIERDDDVVAWWGSLVEGYSAFARLRREEVLTEKEELQSRQILSRLADLWTEVRPSNPVRDQAGRALLLHPLQAADALQLAAALVWSGHQTANVEFVCLDHRLREAAYREGFQVLP
ncbi:MAG: type II toxin-antitoxin system VapC family toxin [Nitrospirales bacterium]|nr:type II toxin-antitoxin system VapC family toxin [Nitrospira sp.]MDR4501620.1 type II toxin-antitoxin system VapC family toxin [Nitrospirales bacterium]